MHNNPNQKKFFKSKKFYIIFNGLMVFLLICCGLYIFWLKPKYDSPLSSPLELSDVVKTDYPQSIAIENEPSEEKVEQENILSIADLQREKREKQEINLAPPVCGKDKELIILAVAIDYRGEDYLYGLADVIRLIRVDFTIPNVYVVALPRALLVSSPPNLTDVADPILINQAYFFGTPGMGRFQGEGYGAGSLAETIHYNFGIEIDNYVVIDFSAFEDFIDNIGGIEVDLPEYVDDRPNAFFPAGKQTLTGAEALQLARIRKKYSDNYRIDNQTLILKAIFSKLKQPETWLKLPGQMDIILNSILTDASINQIQTAQCLLRKLDSNNLHFFNPGNDLILYDWEFIPTMNQEMNIFRWDGRLVEWIYDSLWP